MPPIPEKKPDPVPDPIDIGKILLPKKETGPTPESAQRINAGVLFEQEAAAQLPKVAAPAPAEPPTPKEERPVVSPLQTYRGDVEQAVGEGKGVSVISIAAAEAERRSKKPLLQQTKDVIHDYYRSSAMLAGGAVLVLLAVGALAFVFLRPTTVSVPGAPNAPFIFVDDTVLVPVPAQSTRDTLMKSLQDANKSVTLSIGLIEWLYVAEPAGQDGGAPRQLTASALLQMFSPQIPLELLRTLSTTYLIGVHSFEENQPFLLLQVDSYETAYRAMLDWEHTLRADLLPLFGRNPSPRIKADAPVGSPTSTSVGAEPAPTQLTNTGFVDKVVENRDTRAYLNDAGDILLLWTFLGRNIILITTNEFTMREVLSRLNTAPVVPVP